MEVQPHVSHVRYYFVLLLDILGQKEQLKKWEELPADGVVTDDIRDAVRRSLDRVFTVRKNFTAIVERLHKCDQQALDQQVTELNLPPGPGLDRLKALYVPDVKLLPFSDLLVAYVPATVGQQNDWNINGLQRILELLNILIPKCLEFGIPLRGGICIGPGVGNDDIGFYGPAISIAHDLESRVADYPRVVVSGALRNIIHHDPTEGNGLVGRFLGEAFKRCQSLIADDQDGQTVVDYLGAGSLGSLPGKDGFLPQHRSTVAAAAKFVADERKRFAAAAAAEPAKLAAKYERLQNYFDSRQANWRIPDPPAAT